MSKKDNISFSVIRRLPRYYRFLCELSNNNVSRISSDGLAKLMGLKAPQIRQDLNCFGGFGQQGYGYNVSDLKNEVSNILGLGGSLETILVGVGNLGKAILTHMKFEEVGFKIIGAFDKDISVIGKVISGHKVLDIKYIYEFFKENSPKICVLCIPKSQAESLSDDLINLGIKGFWNFSHFDLEIKDQNIAVENVHLSDSLMTLCYRVNRL